MAVVVAVQLTRSHVAAAVGPVCGSPLLTSTVLTADLDCTGFAGTVLTFGADGITLDGGGHSIIAPDAATVLSIGNRTSVSVVNVNLVGGSSFGIHVSGGSGNLISDVDVSWSGDSRSGRGIYFNGSSNNTFTNVTSTNRGFGILLQGGSSGNTFEGNAITDNVYGLWIEGSSTSNTFQCGSLIGNTYGVLTQPGAGANTVNFSLIAGNAQYGVLNQSEAPVNAENNYWGADDGPRWLAEFRPLPSGSGDRIGGDVDFEPFATAAVQLSNFCNVPPTAVAGTDQTVDEGSTVTLDASGSTDLDGDPIIFDWVLISSSGPAVVLSSTTATTTTFAATDDGVYTFQVTVEDGNGGVDTDDVVVTVRNVAPAVDAGPDAVNFTGEIHQLSASFTDPGVLDTHTATIDWGDSSTSTVAAIEAEGSGTVESSHEYSALGSYTVTVTVVDKDGGSGSDGHIKTYITLIDIKPGSDQNSINPREKGVTPVAILTTDHFDAATVDPTTVLFGPTGTEAAPIHTALEDVDDDGDVDMILHFDSLATKIKCRDTSATLTGETFGGQPVDGSDTVKTVGCK